MFNELKELFENLHYDPANLSHSSTGDGRLDSAESEEGIIQFLIDSFTSSDFRFEKTPPRFWCDIKLYYKEQFFPINIKITTGKSADNISSKEGVFYALTGIEPTEIKGLNRWDGYIKSLQQYINYENNVDYYFLVYFKNEGKFLFTSLKRIETLTPNGSNLPFQCHWGKNKIPTERSLIDQQKYILEVFTQSYIRKANGLETLLVWRNTNYE
jgi:hypothetical protein